LFNKNHLALQQFYIDGTYFFLKVAVFL
jgi:hypothetical protein